MEVKKNIFDYLTIPLGKWFKVPVYLHWSWTIFFGLLLFVDLKSGSSNSVILLGVFLIVILHEFGHCIAAQYYHWKVHHIYLYPIGGAAYMEFQPVPKEELVVSAAGPLVNVLLIPFFSFLTIPFIPEPIWVKIAAVNIVILFFNLLPIFPMDGGRLLRATLQFKLPRLKATLYATRIGQVCCVLLAGFGFMMGHVMLIAISIFIALAGQSELEAAKKAEEKNENVNLLSNSVDTLESLQAKIDKHNKKFD